MYDFIDEKSIFKGSFLNESENRNGFKQDREESEVKNFIYLSLTAELLNHVGYIQGSQILSQVKPHTNRLASISFTLFYYRDGVGMYFCKKM